MSLLRTIRVLSKMSSYRPELLKLNVVCYVCPLLKSGVKELLLAVLQALHVLCEADADAVLQLSHSEEFTHFVQLLTHDDIEVVKVTTSIVLRTAHVPECRGSIGSSGGIEKLLELVNTDTAKQFDLHAKIMRTLSLCCHDVVCRQKLKYTRGLTQLIGVLKAKEYTFNDPAISCILSSLLCYYFDDPSLLYMVNELELAKVLGFRLQQMTSEMEKKEQDDKEESVTASETSTDMDGHSEKDGEKNSGLLFNTTPHSESDSETTFLSSCNSPHSSINVLSSTESSRSSTPIDSDSKHSNLPTAYPGPSTSCDPLSPEWTGGVFPSDYYPNNGDSFIEESCKDTSVFEDILKTFAASPPTSSKGGVSCASPEGFEPTPHNLIDSLLTAPSPYSPTPHLPPRPDINLVKENFNANHPLLTLICRLSFLLHCLPSLAQQSLLVPLMKYFSLTHGQDRCFYTLNRIFKNHHCLLDCVLCLSAPYIWLHICMRTCTVCPLDAGSAETNALAPKDGNLSPHTVVSGVEKSEALSSPPSQPRTNTTSTQGFAASKSTPARSQSNPSVLSLQDASSSSLMKTLISTCNRTCLGLPACSTSVNSTQSACKHWLQRSAELLENLANVAMSPFGTGILANLLLRGSEREKMAAALSVPFLISDPKVMVKMMATYNGFNLLSEIVVNPNQHSDLIDFTLEAFCVIVQRSKIGTVTTVRGNPRSRRESDTGCRMETRVEQEIAQVTASLHLQTLRPPPTFCISPPLNHCPYTSQTQESHQGDPPAAKKSKYECKHFCLYENTLQSRPPDVVIHVELDSLDANTQNATLQAHRSVLSSKSNVFEAMLTRNFRESTESHVSIKSPTLLAFKALMHHAYGCRLNCHFFQNSVFASDTQSDLTKGKNSSSTHSLQQMEMGRVADLQTTDIPSTLNSQLWNSALHVDMLALSDQYFMCDLRQDCEDVLCLTIDKEAVVDLFSIGTVHRARSVQLHCIEYLFSIPQPEERARVARQLMTSGYMADALQVVQEMTNLN